MVQAAGSLEKAPAVVQLPLHNLQLKQMPEDELILGHGRLADDHAQRPINLNVIPAESQLGQACLH